jgi:hypothetical protein
VIVTELDDGMVVGAVKRPADVIVPAEAVHVTEGCPDAVNCCVAPKATDAVGGDTVMGPPVLGDTNFTVTLFETVEPGFLTVKARLLAAIWPPWATIVVGVREATKIS